MDSRCLHREICMLANDRAKLDAELDDKEDLAMYLEKHGDTRIISIWEDIPQQMEIEEAKL